MQNLNVPSQMSGCAMLNEIMMFTLQNVTSGQCAEALHFFSTKMLFTNPSIQYIKEEMFSD